MKERPILMSAPMVRALLEGTKTQTRRVGKIQSPHFSKLAVAYDQHRTKGLQAVATYDAFPGKGTARWGICTCPYGVIGDRLWVKETWAPHRPHLRKTTPRLLKKGEVLNYAADFAHADDVVRLGPWQSPLFMMRHMSRITLEIADVRVERLQDITSTDALAEGLEEDGEGVVWVRGSRPHIEAYDVRDCYRLLWESINGRGSWTLNPWVWVIEFRRGAGA